MLTSSHPLETTEGAVLEGTTSLPGRIANPQLWENNPASQHEVVKEYDGSVLRLHNDRTPNLAVQTEKPEHRVMLILCAQGKTPKEVADLTGYGYQWVLMVKRQPWFKKRLLEMIHAAGEDGVQAYLNNQVMPSLLALEEIRDNTSAKNSDRLSAISQLLDRGLGKAVQHIKTEKVVTPDAAKSEMEMLDRELANIHAAQQSVGLSN